MMNEEILFTVLEDLAVLILDLQAAPGGTPAATPERIV
jgi:hypothetical protein